MLYSAKLSFKPEKEIFSQTNKSRENSYPPELSYKKDWKEVFNLKEKGANVQQEIIRRYETYWINTIGISIKAVNKVRMPTHSTTIKHYPGYISQCN